MYFLTGGLISIVFSLCNTYMRACFSVHVLHNRLTAGDGGLAYTLSRSIRICIVNFIICFFMQLILLSHSRFNFLHHLFMSAVSRLHTVATCIIPALLFCFSLAFRPHVGALEVCFKHLLFEIHDFIYCLSCCFSLLCPVSARPFFACPQHANMAAGTAAAAVTAVIANDVSNRIAKYGEPVKERNSSAFHKLHLMVKGVAVSKNGGYDLKTLASDPTSDKGATGDLVFFNTLLNNIDGDLLDEVLPLISHPDFQLPQNLPGGTFYKILYELNMEASDKLGDTLDSGAAFLRAHGRVEGETFGVFAQRIIAAQASFAKNNPLLFKPAGDTELAKDLLPKVQDELLAIVLADGVNNHATKAAMYNTDLMKSQTEAKTNGGGMAAFLRMQTRVAKTSAPAIDLADKPEVAGMLAESPAPRHKDKRNKAGAPSQTGSKVRMSLHTPLTRHMNGWACRSAGGGRQLSTSTRGACR